MPAVLSALLAVLFWSTNALAAKFALADLSVLQLLVFQFGSAAVALCLWRIARDGVRGFASGWPKPAHIAVGIVGLTGTIFLQYLAFDLGRILEANVIAYAWPLFVAVWAATALRNSTGWAGLALAILGFAGVILIFDSQSGGVEGAGFDIAAAFSPAGGLAYLIALASAGTMAFYTVASARIPATGDRLLIPATVTGALASFALAAVEGSPWPAPVDWLTAIYIGIGPMAAGFFLWTHAMSGEGAKTLAPIGYATPLLSTGVLIASGESFTTQTLVGASLVLTCSIGVLATERLARRGRQREIEAARDCGQA